MKSGFAKIFSRIKKSRAAALSIIAGLTLMFLAVFFLVCGAAYPNVYPNVYVGDIKVGGKTVSETEKLIEEAFSDAAEGRSVKINCCGNSMVVELSELELKPDSKETAKRAFLVGRDGGMFKKAAKLVGSVFADTEISLETEINEAKLEEIIKSMAKGKEEEPIDATYKVDGNILTIVKSKGGKKVNRQKAKNLLAGLLADTSLDELEFELETTEAKAVDADKFYDELTAPAKDAVYKFEDGQVFVEDEKVRVIVDKASVVSALTGDAPQTTIKVETEKPEVLGDELREKLFCHVLGRFSSNFATSTAARASNVSLTANRINGYILMPGDVFSYDKTVGKRTAANGYKEAGVYIGNKVESGIGGGICQTSSTLYSAALYANLEIVSRTSHSLPVSYVPAGQDATIAEGYIDLKLRNNTDYPVKIVAEVKGRNVTCSILGVKPDGQTVEIVHSQYASYEPEIEREADETIPKGYKIVETKGAPGYAVASRRIVKQNGKIVKDEKLTNSIYRASNTIEKVNPADLDAPEDALKIYIPGMEIPEETQTLEPEKQESTSANEDPTKVETQEPQDLQLPNEI